MAQSVDLRWVGSVTRRGFVAVRVGGSVLVFSRIKVSGGWLIFPAMSVPAPVPRDRRVAAAQGQQAEECKASVLPVERRVIILWAFFNTHTQHPFNSHTAKQWPLLGMAGLEQLQFSIQLLMPFKSECQLHGFSWTVWDISSSVNCFRCCKPTVHKEPCHWSIFVFVLTLELMNKCWMFSLNCVILVNTFHKLIHADC